MRAMLYAIDVVPVNYQVSLAEQSKYDLELRFTSGGSSSRCEDASPLSTVRAPLVAGLLSTSCSESEGVELKETLRLRVLGRAEEVEGLPFA